jgi:hypothetical protein
MKFIIIALLSIFVFGCATTTSGIHSEICPKPKTGALSYRLIAEKSGVFDGDNYKTCLYISENYTGSDGSDRFNTYEKYYFDGSVFSSLDDVEQVIKGRKRVALASSDGLSVCAEGNPCKSKVELSKKEDQKNKKQTAKKNIELEENINTCKLFIDDFSRNKMFQPDALLSANRNGHIYYCAVRGFVATPYGDKPTVLTITGNAKTGVYQYQ